jgi:hypothetical protein
LDDVRAVLDPVESALWDEADAVASAPHEHASFTRRVWSHVDEALGELGV